ncbi:hypothetical protein [Eisenbergiella sp.]
MQMDTIRILFIILTIVSLIMAISSFIITLICHKKGRKKIRRIRQRKKALRVEKEIQSLTPEELNELKSEINRVLKEELSNENAEKKKEA